MDGNPVEHSTLRALREMIPYATCMGGPFDHLLPENPATWTAEEIVAARSKYVDDLIPVALKSAGSASTDAPRTLTEGRAWPSDVIGSVTHKGAIALIAVAPAARIQRIGIDLELADEDLRNIRHIIAPEPLPPTLPEALALVLAFSLKEAAYKAMPPEHQSVARFRDLELLWHGNARETTAAPTLRGDPHLRLRARVQNGWVISTAIKLV